jgi:phage gp36-like protein
MAYATINDLEQYAKGGNKFLIHFSDPENQTRNDELLTQRLEAASGFMDSYFSARGSVPLPVESLSPNVVAWLREVCCLLVLQGVEAYKDRATEAKAWLQDFSAGKLVLGDLSRLGWYDKPELDQSSYDQWAEIETMYEPTFPELREVF